MKWHNFVFNNHYQRLQDDVCEYIYIFTESVVTFPPCHCVFLIHEEPKLSPWFEEYPACQPGCLASQKIVNVSYNSRDLASCIIIHRSPKAIQHRQSLPNSRKPMEGFEMEQFLSKYLMFYCLVDFVISYEIPRLNIYS